MRSRGTPGYSRELVAGGMRTVDDRCIIPVVSLSTITGCAGGYVSVVPVALIVIDDGVEEIVYLSAESASEELRCGIEALCTEVVRTSARPSDSP
ncbi:hypothetical protein FGU65_07840 [Methanoculleus sp. FWC-SCC1]|uniref:DUF302 domain-containing protein n=1 Tax=Methanoculleus frigidifontis TaxID=2584085 RepID=A0ABT8MA79_9EURY|nr:hypothetical protein [Methanoculleus sp. FWC-SCC1]MDN7024796.1 hypothetical protein [Methanoculleus sp. FWC-SCC1]